MAVHRILLEDGIGETRAVAFDTAGLAVAVWLERWSDRVIGRLRLGDVRDARVRSLEPSLRGAFADLGPGKDAAFIRLTDGHGLTEGQMARFRVEAEATRGKLPRGVLATNAILHRAGFEDWRGHLPGGRTATIEPVPPGMDAIQHIFDDLLATEAQIPGGGTLTIERTTALTAVDVDTSGRTARGSAASRALQVNGDAARELARQCSLRSLGGLVVMDCIAPINGESGRKVRDTFMSAWREVSLRTAKAEPPSPFGLMELSLAWGETPLAERLEASAGTPLPETACLAGIRTLQKALQQKSMDRPTLRLPAAAHDWLTGMHAAGLDLGAALAEKYGARFEILAADIPKPEVA